MSKLAHWYKKRAPMLIWYKAFALSSLVFIVAMAYEWHDSCRHFKYVPEEHNVSSLEFDNAFSTAITISILLIMSLKQRVWVLLSFGMALGSIVILTELGVRDYRFFPLFAWLSFSAGIILFQHYKAFKCVEWRWPVLMGWLGIAMLLGVFPLGIEITEIMCTVQRETYGKPF